MRFSLFSAAVLATGVAAVPNPQAGQPSAPALPMSDFNTHEFKGWTLEEAKQGRQNEGPAPTSSPSMGIMATCSNPRTRIEWDNYSTSDRTAFISAIKCLMGKPRSGAFAAAQNKYEDMVALHQTLTPNVHSSATVSNAKFLLWHRYYLWTFEDLLRTECGFNRALPWFDERKYAGRFSQSSIFSSQWFGGIALGGQCVTNGAFAGLTLNIGPGTGNQRHCLARNGDAAKTARTGASYVNECNAYNTYSGMAACSEGTFHAWGHNGIGAVMSDVYASPADPVFWLHHGFIDRNFRVWQNAATSRKTTVDGSDRNGNRLTLDTTVSVNNIRPTVQIRDILDTMNTHLCYKYDY